MPDFTYEITEELDIRDWAPEHEKMGKGVSLSAEEVKKLKEILEGIE